MLSFLILAEKISNFSIVSDFLNIKKVKFKFESEKCEFRKSSIRSVSLCGWESKAGILFAALVKCNIIVYF